MKFQFKKLIPTFLLTVFVLAISTNVAHANFLGLEVGLWDGLWAIVANLLQIFLTATAWLVGLTGTLLNVSLTLTTNLGAFINDTPVIFTIWTIIRDLASVILIFFILWAAMQMILNLKEADFGGLIKSIVIMGILINFSFFFARVLIDASNIVSLQFYNAIAPGKEYVRGSSISDWTLSAFADGGLSNIFMGALKVNEWYSNKGVIGEPGSNPEAAPIRIYLITIGGIIVMIFASLSFLGAAAAAIIRTIMLILLVAFSPIWIVSMALPQMKEYTKDWWNHFKTQLLFLPVYLLGMYVVIRILTESNLNKLTVSSSAFISQGNLNEYTSLFVGFAIIIVMLNVPLVMAIKISGAKDTLTEKWFRGAQSFLGRRTLGRAAYGMNQSTIMKMVSSASPTIGRIASTGLSKISSRDFGSDNDKGKGSYNDTLKAKAKDQQDFYKQIGNVDESRFADNEKGRKALATAKSDAKMFQGKYRGNLAWKRGSVIGFMVDNRANLQSTTKLNKEATKEEKKEAKNAAKKTTDNINSIIAMLRSENDIEYEKLNPLLEKVKSAEKVNTARKALDLESITQNEEKKVDELNRNKAYREERIAYWEEQARNLKGIIKEGEAIEDGEKDSKVLDEIQKLKESK